MLVTLRGLRVKSYHSLYRAIGFLKDFFGLN